MSPLEGIPASTPALHVRAVSQGAPLPCGPHRPDDVIGDRSAGRAGRYFVQAPAGREPVGGRQRRRRRRGKADSSFPRILRATWPAAVRRLMEERLRDLVVGTPVRQQAQHLAEASRRVSPPGKACPGSAGTALLAGRFSPTARASAMASSNGNALPAAVAVAKAWSSILALIAATARSWLVRNAGNRGTPIRSSRPSAAPNSRAAWSRSPSLPATSPSPANA